MLFLKNKFLLFFIEIVLHFLRLSLKSNPILLDNNVFHIIFTTHTSIITVEKSHFFSKMLYLNNTFYYHLYLDLQIRLVTYFRLILEKILSIYYSLKCQLK